MAIIIIATTVDKEKVEIALTGKLYVGRLAGCHYVFGTDDRMSSKHGQFHINPLGEVAYRDLNSSNGSFVNGIRITDTIMKITDEIRLGATLFRIDETRLTQAERDNICGKALDTNLGEDRTIVITKSEIFARPQFEKTAIGKSPSLAERWNLGEKVLSAEEEKSLNKKSEIVDSVSNSEKVKEKNQSLKLEIKVDKENIVRKAAPKSNVDFKSDQNMIELEKSTGETKMLKLVKAPTKKK